MFNQSNLDNNFLSFSITHKKYELIYEISKDLLSKLQEYKSLIPTQTTSPPTNQQTNSTKNIFNQIDSYLTFKSFEPIKNFIKTLKQPPLSNFDDELFKIKKISTFNTNFISNINQISLELKISKNSYETTIQEFHRFVIYLQAQIASIQTNNNIELDYQKIERDTKDYQDMAYTKEQNFDKNYKLLVKQLDFNIKNLKENLTNFSKTFQNQLWGLSNIMDPILSKIKEFVSNFQIEILSILKKIDTPHQSSNPSTKMDFLLEQDNMEFQAQQLASSENQNSSDKSISLQVLTDDQQWEMFCYQTSFHNQSEKYFLFKNIINCQIQLSANRSEYLTTINYKMLNARSLMQDSFANLLNFPKLNLYEKSNKQSCLSNSLNLTCDFYINFLKHLKALENFITHKNLYRNLSEIVCEYIRDEKSFKNEFNFLLRNFKVSGINGEFLDKLRKNVGQLVYTRQKFYRRLEIAIMDSYDQLNSLIKKQLDLFDWRDDIQKIMNNVEEKKLVNSKINDQIFLIMKELTDYKSRIKIDKLYDVRYNNVLNCLDIQFYFYTKKEGDCNEQQYGVDRQASERFYQDFSDLKKRLKNIQEKKQLEFFEIIEQENFYQQQQSLPKQPNLQSQKFVDRSLNGIGGTGYLRQDNAVKQFSELLHFCDKTNFTKFENFEMTNMSQQDIIKYLHDPTWRFNYKQKAYKNFYKFLFVGLQENLKSGSEFTSQGVPTDNSYLADKSSYFTTKYDQSFFLSKFSSKLFLKFTKFKFEITRQHNQVLFKIDRIVKYPIFFNLQYQSISFIKITEFIKGLQFNLQSKLKIKQKNCLLNKLEIWIGNDDMQNFHNVFIRSQLSVASSDNQKLQCDKFYNSISFENNQTECSEFSNGFKDNELSNSLILSPVLHQDENYNNNKSFLEEFDGKVTKINKPKKLSNKKIDLSKTKKFDKSFNSQHNNFLNESSTNFLDTQYFPGSNRNRRNSRSHNQVYLSPKSNSDIFFVLKSLMCNSIKAILFIGFIIFVVKKFKVDQ